MDQIKLNAPRWALECSVNSKGWRKGCRLRAVSLWLMVAEDRESGRTREVGRHTERKRGERRRSWGWQRLFFKYLNPAVTSITVSYINVVHFAVVKPDHINEMGNQVKHTWGQTGIQNTMSNLTIAKSETGLNILFVFCWHLWGAFKTGMQRHYFFIETGCTWLTAETKAPTSHTDTQTCTQRALRARQDRTGKRVDLLRDHSLVINSLEYEEVHLCLLIQTGRQVWSLSVCLLMWESGKYYPKLGYLQGIREV